MIKEVKELNAFRKEKNLSIKNLARYMQLNYWTVFAWIKGKRKPLPVMRLFIQDYLKGRTWTK